MRNAVSMLAAVALLSGCKLLSPDPAASFKSFQDTWTVALAAYDAHCERVVQGKVKPESEAIADAAWNKFRLSFRTAFVAASSNWSAPVPPPVALEAKTLIATLDPQ